MNLPISPIVAPVLSTVLVLSAVSMPLAATTTATFNAQIIIIEDCDIVSASNLDFGTEGVLASNVDATASLSVQCTNSTTYNIGLDAGSGAGATTATRKMTNGLETVDYQMFSNAGRTSNWGNSVGTDTVAATGNGSSQSYTIYGRVPPQSTPSANTYTDTVTLTVTF